ncbi:hypothetical protein ACOQFB_01020 [Anaeromyxobacter sp. Red801]|uniref:hypothetical protein n=1 Tax=Anaeromyxobacter sp. Red801 TaxID=3411632 RepID=UPI003BA0CAC5
MKNATFATVRQRSKMCGSSRGHSAGVITWMVFSAGRSWRASVTGFGRPSHGPPCTRAASKIAFRWPRRCFTLFSLSSPSFAPKRRSTAAVVTSTAGIRRRRTRWLEHHATNVGERSPAPRVVS